MGDIMIFEKARPVWAADMGNEKNCELSFRVCMEKAGGAELRVAASGEYQLVVNGRFAAFGPAKTARGFFKVDVLDLTPYLTEARNVVVLNVLCARINSFSLQDQPSFAAAEISAEGKCLFWTDENGTFPAWLRGCRIQKVQRFSYQRTFAEAYRLTPRDALFETQPEWENAPCLLHRTDEKRFLPRDVRYPQYPRAQARLIGAGAVDFHGNRAEKYRDRSYTDIGPRLRGFPIDELEERLSDEAQEFSYQPMPQAALPDKITAGYALYEFPINMTGFFQLEISCEAACTVYALFDEILTDGDVNFLRMTSCNCVKYSLQAGSYALRSFQPYTMKYLKLVVRGSAQLRSVGMIQFKHPQPVMRIRIPQDDPELQKIAHAALESFQQNAVDFFYDCPSRERAGWLCDSFFTARVERLLTGESILERAFLQNFLLPERFDHIPDGMLPMCYPSDHDNAEYIPNWAMWFVLELKEYLARSADRALIEAARPRVCALLRWLAQYENADGLLERLPGWIFVEWSAANDWVQDVNFPTNMLYARTLCAAAELYAMPELAEKGRTLAETIRRRSYNGRFFTDHEVIDKTGRYVNPGHQSEACQYYAFFLGIADRESYPELWRTLVGDFGPERAADCWPDVAPANAFIGDYLRLELLYLDGQREKLLADIRGFFLPMAERTGTLWENNLPTASCCHGFASHVLYWLAGLFGTEVIPSV